MGFIFMGFCDLSLLRWTIIIIYIEQEYQMPILYALSIDKISCISYDKRHQHTKTLSWCAHSSTNYDSMSKLYICRLSQKIDILRCRRLIVLQATCSFDARICGRRETVDKEMQWVLRTVENVMIWSGLDLRSMWSELNWVKLYKNQLRWSWCCGKLNSCFCLSWNSDMWQIARTHLEFSHYLNTIEGEWTCLNLFQTKFIV